MPEVQSLKSSAELRQELAGIDLDVLRFEGDLASETAKIKLHALSARRGDPAAVKRIAESEAKKRSIEISISHAGFSKELLAGEITEAEHHEAYERRKVEAAEQERVAELLDSCADECDAALTAFRVGYMKLVELGRQANPYREDDFAAAARPGGRESLIRSNLVECFRWAMHDAGLKWLDIKPPHPLTALLDERGLPTGTPPKPTFARCARSWATAARGAAKRLLAPVGPKKANGHDAVAAALKLNGKPYHPDIGEALPGDPPNFRIYDPGAKQ